MLPKSQIIWDLGHQNAQITSIWDLGFGISAKNTNYNLGFGIWDLEFWHLGFRHLDFEFGRQTKSFTFGNIYDVTKETSHATLRIVLQSNISSNFVSSEVIQLNEETPLFGMKPDIQKILNKFQKIFEKILNFKIEDNQLIYNREFDTKLIKKIILSELDSRCHGSSPSIIILEPGNNPNSDDTILNAAMMYKLDLKLGDDDYLDIVADQALFGRLIKCKEKWPKLRPLLGQFHTSKDFCSVLLVLFSSYGIFNFASELGLVSQFNQFTDYLFNPQIICSIRGSSIQSVDNPLNPSNLRIICSIRGSSV
ncbi:hypothetical protein Glove_460g65 [Diversispora epigaea]|uniref:Uncharacterized protein n=1 Tax=Diversispora epigaea TaxID=1348612 RepID=A0A397GP16_9GLOM|nr:hypothetical protein Glove_460g65 [Diversispora epigaea]